MRPTEAHGQRRCFVEVDRAGEETVQEGKWAPQRGRLEVETARDASALQAYAPDMRGCRHSDSEEQVFDDLGPDGSLLPPLCPPLWGIELAITDPEVHQCPRRRCLPDLPLGVREVAAFHCTLQHR